MPDQGLLAPAIMPTLDQAGSLIHQIVPPSLPGFGTTLPLTAASTRFPTAVGRAADPTKTPMMSSDLEAYLASPAGQHNVGLLGGYPGMAFLKGMPTNEAAQAAIQRFSENMTHVFERSPRIMQRVSPIWYEGGNRITSEWADKYGVPQQSMAAATAVLSPSKDWFQNVSMAQRTADILFNKAKMPFSSDMAARGKEIYTSPANQQLLKRITGKRLIDLKDPTEKAAWIRLYDEAHHSSHYRAVAPDGGLGDFVRNADGSERVMVWQSLDNVAKSVKALESGGDMKTISPLLGVMHKFRNFYNNLTHPEHQIGATVDTHQVAGGLLSPLGSKDIAVKHAMPGTPLTPEDRAAGEIAAMGSSVTGFKGTYPIFEAATKRAGEQLGLLQHKAQSGVWEPVRTLFDVKSPKMKQAVAGIWGNVDRGLLSPAQARDQIFEVAGGIKLPDWAAGGLLLNPRSASTY